MNKKILLLVFVFMVGFAESHYPIESSSDAQGYESRSAVICKSADSYEQALNIWKTPEDINLWIADNFIYDEDRALRHSENQKAMNKRNSIYRPDELFTIKSGICVDLSRFGVETLRRINPASEPQYLLIEFDPVQVAGNTLRLHWMVSFKRNGKHYFFADSKRPGYIAGPYNSAQDFINEYSQYRSRKIVSFRKLDSFQKEASRFKKRILQQKCP